MKYDQLSEPLQRQILEDRATGCRSPYAAPDAHALRREPGKDRPNPLRPAYVRDVEAILHSAYYNRYVDKTQVFSFYRNDDITRRALHVQLVSRIARTAAGMHTAGTHSATSHQRPLGMMVLNSVMNSFVSDGVLFIFQLPAITVLRYFRFMVSISYISQSL